MIDYYELTFGCSYQDFLNVFDADIRHTNMLQAALVKELNLLKQEDQSSPDVYCYDGQEWGIETFPDVTNKEGENCFTGEHADHKFKCNLDIKLDCGHSYHIQYIKQWLEQKNTCLVCKSEPMAQG